MILIDPQCGVSVVALAGLFKALASEGANSGTRDILDFPGEGTVRLIYERLPQGMSGTFVTTRAERDTVIPENLDMSKIERVLCVQKDIAPQAARETMTFLSELASYREHAGKKPELPAETVLAAQVLFKTTERLEQTMLSLPVGTGSGTRQTREGPESIPSLEVLSIAGDYSIPIRGLAVEGPTCDDAGLLFLAKFGRFTTRMPSVIPGAVVRSAEPGKGSMRAMVVREKTTEDLWLLEASLDDATGEEMGLAIEILQEVSLEAHVVQALGKKGRPLYLLRVLARDNQLEEVLQRYFRDTPTIGVRYWPVGRMKMERHVENGELVTNGYRLSTRVKISRLGDIAKGKAEWDDLGHLLKGKILPVDDTRGG